ncbi:AAA-domain-containing protein [Mycena sanguinolenta]|uniref:AAA-domain-containing protein n=1 Tax=Mycena sanguinolenta TaxID=230812 RepID=A0A8H6YAC0_9AGAR|nr:AAA-domain-containing protein [Mycena sanguinolenta]
MLLPMSSPELPAAVVDKCFIPYTPNLLPSLYGVPIDLGLAKQPSSTPFISLSPILMSKAVTAISAAFTSRSSEKPSISDDNGSLKSPVLPVLALCSPDINSLVAVDAAIRHIAHCLEANVVILDPSDLAADLTQAFWELYRYHQNGPEPPSMPPRSPWNSSSPFEPSIPPLMHSLGFSPSEFTPTSHSAMYPHPNPFPLPEGIGSVSDSDSTFARAQTLIRKYFLMQSASTGSDNSETRRQIIYLRDYTALSKGLLPLLPFIHDAVSAGTPTVVIAGISPTERLDGSDSGHFLDWLEHDEGDIIDRLHARHGASLPPGNDIALWRKSSLPSSSIGMDEKGKALARVIRLGAIDPPSAVHEYTQKARRKRFDIPFSFMPEPHVYITAEKIPTVFHSTIFDDDKVNAIAKIIRSPAALADVLTAFSEADDTSVDTEDEDTFIDTEWSRLILAAKARHRLQKSDSNKARITDPILARVRAQQASLDKYEKQMLECVVDPTTIETSFADVCVDSELIDAVRMAVSYPLLFPDAYTTGILAQESLGGVLLFGPPGTGKTMACRALAKECRARMLQLQSSHLQNCYVGETEKMIAGAFRLARRLGPCVMFIDELEGLFCKRDGSSKPWHRAMVTEFTQEMDGLSTARTNQRAGLVVVGATNRPQDLDSAVVRGLSRRILVDLPTLLQRKAIISRYLRDEKVDPAIDVRKLASRTPLFSGSDLRHLVHCAALAALKEITPTTWQIQYGADGVPIPYSRKPLPPRVIRAKHFDIALRQISASSATNRKDLDELRRWAKELFQSDYCN